jgi:hypothetical protein
MTRIKVISMVVAVALISGPAASAVPDTVFGMSSGDSTLAAQDKKFGHVDVARVFNDSPKSWDKMPNRPLVVSFKIPPRSVTAGEWDGVLRNWFRTAPKTYPVWWTYWHEPDDNFSTAIARLQYQQAWKHIVRIERANAPRNLRSTVINTLLSAKSGTWARTYPGDRWIDVLGWDGKLHAWDEGYIPAKEFYRAAVRISNGHNKPWGLAEYGSLVFNRDYKGRAQWMKNTAHWLQNSGARFATWWPQVSAKHGDYRLNDQPSIDAMKWKLRGAWQ